MQYVLGIDGGGTKTAFCVMEETGRVRSTVTDIGTSYRQHGFDAVCDTVARGMRAALDAAGISREALSGVAFGAPCYGESPSDDETLLRRLTAALGPLPLRLENDVVVGWAGSLGLAPGINVVAGTGAIAFGRDEQGNGARCGGWDEWFSDEGSCYWLGLRLLSLFSKEADGRLPRGPLYDIVRGAFSLQEDFALVQVVIDRIRPDRRETAALQLLLLEAARQGDAAAVSAYADAAQELALLVHGVQDALHFEKRPLRVSGSGGLFKAGELIMTPFCRALDALDATFFAPRYSPCEGAALLALETFAPGAAALRMAGETPQ